MIYTKSKASCEEKHLGLLVFENNHLKCYSFVLCENHPLGPISLLRVQIVKTEIDL